MNQVHRRVVISDAEQLIATLIIITWAVPDRIFLLGTDNMNVLAWTKKGYSKTGASLRLNQETSRWIAIRKLRVEPFYLRSGRNFSPDWMTRAPKEEVSQWAEQNGFTRIRARPYWDEMMTDRKDEFKREVIIPLNRMRVAPTQKLCVEWNGSGNCFSTASDAFGMTFCTLPLDTARLQTVFSRVRL